jgi:Protein of unknown function (DUF664)
LRATTLLGGITGAELPDERSVLIDYLRDYRLTLEMKCAGLDAGQLARRSVPPSTLSLLGLIRHMADVERAWFRQTMADQDVAWLFLDGRGSRRRVERRGG